MPRQKKTETRLSPIKGQEKSPITALKEITKSDAETYFILWKYAPELLPNGAEIKTFDDLKNTYKNLENRTEQSFEKALYKEDVQAGIRYVLKRLDGKRDVDLLNKYFELAMSGDVQALKAYMDFKENFFADTEANELKAILGGVSISRSSEEDDDFEMDF